MHNKLSPWQRWCPNTTFWKYWEKKTVFAYVNVSRHVNDKILRLQGKMLVKEKAKTKAKNINGVNQNLDFDS